MMSFDGSFTNELFCTSEVQKTSKSGDATDALGDAQGVPTMEDAEIKQQESEYEDSASDKEGNKCSPVESDDEIVV